MCDGRGTVTYGYDNANQLTSLQEPGGNCAATPVTGACTQFAYVDTGGVFHDGQVVKTTYPLGTTVTATYGYDLAQNLTSMTYKKGASTIYTASYDRTTTGADTALIQYRGSTDGNNWYRYDNHNQLCWAAPSSSTNTCATPPAYSNSYTYDPAGNRTTDTDASAGTVTKYAFNAANELCARTTGGTTPTCTSPNYTYDATGNRLTGPTSIGPTWTYNPKNQAASYTPPGGSAVTISYHDTDSTEQTAIGATSYAASPLGLAAQKISTTTTYMVRTPHGQILSQNAAGTPLYYIQDALGSIVGTFNNTGTRTRTYKYDPIGRNYSATGSGTTPNYQYAGGLALTNGLYKYGTRYYDPNNSGTWTQPDPSGQDPNPYTYTAGNPTNYTDPSGYSFLDTALNVVGYVADAVSVVGGATCFVTGGIGCGVSATASFVSYGASALKASRACGSGGDCDGASASLVRNSLGVGFESVIPDRAPFSAFLTWVNK